MSELSAAAATRLNPVDLTVIAAYAALMIAAGILFTRYTKSTKDLFAAGGNVPWWVAGISSYMTFFSAGTFVAWGSLAYVFGWVAITIQWVIVVTTMVAAVFFAHRWKRIGVDSPIQFLEERFSLGVRQLYVWVRVPFGTVIAAQAVYCVSVLVHDQFGVGYSLNSIIFVMTALVVVYTVLGGLWAVLATDVLQFFILTLVTLLTLPLALKAAGGWETFVDKAPPGFFQLAQNAADYAQPYRVKFTWSYFLWWTVIYIFVTCTKWEFIQRFQSCRSEKEAKWSGYLVAALYVVTPIFWLLPLMIYRVIDPSYYNPAEPLATKQAEVVYIAMCRRLLPVGLIGLALVAMVSATGSMVNSILNVMAAVVTRDFYARLLRKNPSERELVLVGRCIIVLLGAFVALVACGIYGWGGVVEYIFIYFPIIYGPLTVPFLWGVISRRTSAKAVWYAVLAGIAVSLAVEFVLPKCGLEVTLASKLLASAAVPFFVLIIGQRLMPPKPEKQKTIDLFFNRMNTPLVIPRQKGTAEYGPIALIGVLTAILGFFMLQLIWFVDEQRLLIFFFSLAMIAFGGFLVLIKRLAERRDRKTAGTTDPRQSDLQDNITQQ